MQRLPETAFAQICSSRCYERVSILCEPAFRLLVIPKYRWSLITQQNPATLTQWEAENIVAFAVPEGIG